MSGGIAALLSGVGEQLERDHAITRANPPRRRRRVEVRNVVPPQAFSSTTHKHKAGLKKALKALLKKESVPMAVAQPRVYVQAPPKARASRLRSSPIAATFERSSDPMDLRRTEASYLYGFVDPMKAGRGPANSDMPTVLATFTSVENITLAAATNDVSANWPTDDIHRLNAANSIGIACGPTPVYSQLLDLPVSFRPGFTFDGSQPLDTRIDTAIAAGVTPWMPLAPYNQEYPGGFTSQAGTNVSPGDLTQFCRCVGLRATLEITTPALTAQGVVYAGDNNELMPDPERALHYINAPAITTKAFDEESNNLVTAGMANGRSSSRIMNVGTFTNGNVYEAQFLPVNDNLINYRSRFNLATGRTDEFTTSDYIGNQLVDHPFVFFFLEGIAPGSTVTVSTSFTVEMPIGLKSELGFLIAEARMSHRFVPDWSWLSQVPTGGLCCDGINSYLDIPMGQLGMAIVTGSTKKAKYMVPASMGLQPVGSTITYLAAHNGVNQENSFSDNVRRAVTGGHTLVRAVWDNPMGREILLNIGKKLAPGIF